MSNPNLSKPEERSPAMAAIESILLDDKIPVEFETVYDVSNVMAILLEGSDASYMFKSVAINISQIWMKFGKSEEEVTKRADLLVPLVQKYYVMMQQALSEIAGQLKENQEKPKGE